MRTTGRRHRRARASSGRPSACRSVQKRVGRELRRRVAPAGSGFGLRAASPSVAAAGTTGTDPRRRSIRQPRRPRRSSRRAGRPVAGAGRARREQAYGRASTTGRRWYSAAPPLEMPTRRPSRAHRVRAVAGATGPPRRSSLPRRRAAMEPPEETRRFHEAGSRRASSRWRGAPGCAAPTPRFPNGQRGVIGMKMRSNENVDVAGERRVVDEGPALVCDPTP